MLFSDDVLTSDCLVGGVDLRLLGTRGAWNNAKKFLFSIFRKNAVFRSRAGRYILTYVYGQHTGQQVSTAALQPVVSPHELGRWLRTGCSVTTRDPSRTTLFEVVFLLRNSSTKIDAIIRPLRF